MPVRVRLGRAGVGRVGVSLAVRTSGTAGLGACPERFVNDGLDGARAPAAFGAAAEAAIDLLGITRQILGSGDGTADILIGKDVAGTNNHENGGPIGDAEAHRYLRPRPDAKGKTVVSSDSKLDRIQTGMSLKTLGAAALNASQRFGLSLIAAATPAVSSTAAAAAIASTGVTGTAGIAGVARSGMVAAVPVGMRNGMRSRMGMVSTGATEITAAVRSGTIGRPAPVCRTLPSLLEQQQANQQGPTDCDTDHRHLARHVAYSRMDCRGCDQLCTAKTPPIGPYSSANVAEPFIDHSNEM
jgi:hypothetical protein